MTVGELKKHLEGIPDDRMIVLDAEWAQGDLVSPDEIIGITAYQVRDDEFMYSNISGGMKAVNVIRIS